MRSLISFFVLLSVKYLSKIFFRFKVEWVGERPENPWSDLRILAVLHHTSLYEPILVGAAENAMLWRVARYGVLPVAAKTMRRTVGLFFRLLANRVVVVTRKKDHTWQKVLDAVEGDSTALLLILPEGRMMRPNGLDANGQPMTVRGGIADIIRSIPSGRMLLVYSGGLHHIQAPGELLPRPFKTVRLRLELVDIASYREELMAQAGEDGFKRAVIQDMERRRDTHCPITGQRPIPSRQPEDPGQRRGAA